MADIDRVYGGSHDSRRKARKHDYDDHDVSNDNTADISNRGANARQSKSANAARSLTRKNQQQLNT